MKMNNKDLKKGSEEQTTVLRKGQMKNHLKADQNKDTCQENQQKSDQFLPSFNY